MRVIIAGSRFIGTAAAVQQAMSDAAAFGIEPTAVLCGMARGVDLLGKEWADERGIPVEPFPARWRNPDGTYNPRAGFQRNVDMANNADALVAVWDGQSTGTADMIKKAEARNLQVWVHQHRLRDQRG